MATRKPTHSPQWIGVDAKKFYQRMIKTLPPLDDWQRELLAIASEWYETFRNAQGELQEHVSKHGTFTVPGSAGNVSPHPAIRILKMANDTCAKNMRMLYQSLGKEIQQTVEDDLEEFLTDD